MKEKKWRILRYLFMLAIVFGMIVSVKQEALAATTLKVFGQNITNPDTTDYVDPSGKWYYTHTGNILTLEGVTYEGENDGIYFEDMDLKIVIKGANSITSENTSINEHYGIHALRGDLTICGDGQNSLSLNGEAGIYTTNGSVTIKDKANIITTGKNHNGGILMDGTDENDLTIDDATVDARSVAEPDEDSFAIFYATGGNINIINNAKVTAVADAADAGCYSRGICASAPYSNPSIVIGANVSSVVATGYDYAMLADNGIKNSVSGTGWTDVTGTQGAAAIETSDTGHALNDYKKIVFPKATPTITKAPTAKTLSYTGSAQELVNTGSVSGGSMKYAIGTNTTTEPDDATFSTTIPTGTEAKTYYVWYKGVGSGAFSGNTAAGCVAVTISAPVTYKITFDANGGSGSMASETVNKDSSYTLPACTFTAPEGKEFDKWDQGAVGASIKITSDTTIKAQWKDKAVTPDKGQQDQQQPSGTDDQATNPAPTATEEKTETVDKKQKNTTLSKPKAGKKSIKLKWKKATAKGIKGYEIQCSTDKNFKKDVKTVTIKKVKTTSTTIKKLKSKKKYFVRIRTFRKSGTEYIYSKWSKVKSVKVK